MSVAAPCAGITQIRFLRSEAPSLPLSPVHRAPVYETRLGQRGELRTLLHHSKANGGGGSATEGAESEGEANPSAAWGASNVEAKIAGQAPHPFQPAFVVESLVLEIPGYLGMGKDQEALLSYRLDHMIGHLGGRQGSLAE